MTLPCVLLSLSLTITELPRPRFYVHALSFQHALSSLRFSSLTLPHIRLWSAQKRTNAFLLCRFFLVVTSEIHQKRVLH